jgi:SAM-dependent methyltransferase
MKNILSIPIFYRFLQFCLANPMLMKMKGYLDDKQIISNPNLTILDVGCGPGDYSQWYAGIYTGIDISEQYIESASSKYLNASFIVCDATDYDLTQGGSKSWDVAVSIGLYHHLPDDDVLKSIKVTLNHLKPQGKFYIFDAILPITFMANPLGYVLRKLDRGKFVRSYEEYQRFLNATDINISYRSIGRGGLLDYVVYVIEK